MFGFKKEEKKESCSCSRKCSSEVMKEDEQIEINGNYKVLGGGCAKCHELVDNTKAALSELGLNEDVEFISDFSVIASYGVMSTPALVIDDKVVGYGKVLNKQEIIEIIKNIKGKE